MVSRNPYGEACGYCTLPKEGPKVAVIDGNIQQSKEKDPCPQLDVVQPHTQLTSFHSIYTVFYNLFLIL